MALDKIDDYIRANALTDENERVDWRQSVWSCFEAEVANAKAAGCHTFVCSAEHFQTRLDREDEVQSVKQFLRGLFDEIEVVTYLRRQDRAAVSHYSEQIRNGLTPDSVLPAVEGAYSVIRILDYLSALKLWSGVFGDRAFHVCIYDRDCLTGHDIATDFSARFGLPPLRFSTEGEGRESLSASALAAMLMLNQQVPIDERDDSERRAKRQAFDVFLASEVGPAPKPSRKEAEAFLKAFDSVNREIAKRWLHREKLFSNTIDDYPEQAVEPDLERAKSLLSEFEAIWQGQQTEQSQQLNRGNTDAT